MLGRDAKSIASLTRVCRTELRVGSRLASHAVNLLRSKASGMNWKPKRLHPRWRKWRSARRRELIGAGADPDQAARIATAEARGRSNIARLVGHGAAMNAELVFVRQGGEDRVYLKGALDEVPSAWRPRVSDLTSLTIQSFAGRGRRRKRPGTD